MLGAVAIQDFAFIGRVGGSFQEIFDVVDGAVEKVSIRAAHIEVDLAPELGPERRPIPLEDMAQVIVFTPLRGNLGVDFAAHLVEDSGRITVLPHR